MIRIAKVGDITYKSEDCPNPRDPKVQQRLRNLVDLAMCIGRREGMFKSLLPLPEDINRQESDNNSR